MAPRETPRHWLAPTKRTRLPRRVVYFDSESRTSLTRNRERHDFRMAVCALDELDRGGAVEDSSGLVRCSTPLELWTQIAEWTSPQHRTLAYAHKLSYDLRLTAALPTLAALGWHCDRLSLNDYSCWARFTLGRRVLMLCDSYSWIGLPLDRIAQLQNLSRRRLPAGDATEEAWWRRCENDVQVLRLTMLRLLGFIGAEQLGDWQLTGAGQASAAYRARFLPEKAVLVHWDKPARAAERRAAWTGRTEVWKWGELRGPLYEYDYTAAYAHLCRKAWLPTKLLGEVHRRRGKRRETLPRGRTLLMECDVRTETPTVPTERDGRIVWPVGEFTTTLWDVEAALAEREGADLTIRRAWLYETQPALQGWAKWILAALDGAPPGDDLLLRALLKHWSRALVGRFALSYPLLDLIDQGLDDRFELYWCKDAATDSVLRLLQLGDRLYQQTADQDSQNSVPSITSSVTALARVNLWATMRRAGLEHVAYVDTDSLLVDQEGADRLERALARGRHKGLRLKGTYRSALLTAPRQIEIGDVRRVSGLPRHASRRTDGTYTAEVWESLPGALRRRRPSAVFVTQRSMTLDPTDSRREHLDDGRTSPFRLG